MKIKIPVLITHKSVIFLTRENKKWYWFSIFYNCKHYRNIFGVLNRENGPAVEYKDGGFIWYKNGKKHRDDGPAYKYVTNDSEIIERWYLNDIIHKTDGPAIITYDLYNKHHIISKEWCENGDYHRLNGPARIINGREYFCWFGRNVTESNYWSIYQKYLTNKYGKQLKLFDENLEN